MLKFSSQNYYNYYMYARYEIIIIIIFKIINENFIITQVCCLNSSTEKCRVRDLKSAKQTTFFVYKHFIFINRDDFVIYILLMYNWRKIRSWKAKTYKHTAHFKLYIVMTPRYLVVITCKNRANFCCCCTSRKYIVVYEVKMLCRYFLLHTHARQYLYKNSYYALSVTVVGYKPKNSAM